MIKNVVSLSTLSCFLLFGSIVYADEPQLSPYGEIAYAYMQDGTKLVKITTQLEDYNKDNIEIIRITNGGFYPNYSMNSKTEEGKGGEKGCLAHMSDDSKDLSFCRSHYTSREALMTGFATLFNAAATFTTVGLNVATGALADPKYFHKNDFLEVVKNSDIQKYREALIALNTYAMNKGNEINNLYTQAYNDYTDNKKMISIIYTLQDKSDLFQAKEIDGGYYVELNAPQRKTYEYMSFLNKEIFAQENDNLDTHIEQIKNKIDDQFNKDMSEYKKYITDNFKNYKLIGQPSKMYPYNNKISFYASIKTPAKEIPYTLGKKTTITVPVTVEYANVQGMIPQEYAIQDGNFNMVMRTNSGLSVNGIMSNKTQSFITVKSLTSYYQSLVYNVSNMDKELAPEARDLDDGTSYSLITTAMSAKSNFEKVTKNSAQKIKLNYGYAVKYKVNDTNIEKAIYNTKNYSLYDVIQQYI
ncbi:MAG: hypothetical protein PHO27_07720 [Sulfuricurvum sp.]|nr:hypothetical protein [Sulfuricurvum sp.]